MKTLEAAKGHWPKIFEYFGLPPVTGKRHYKGECPVCGSQGKFRIDDRNGEGTWICCCGSGNGMKLLIRTQNKPFSELCAEIDKLIGNDYRHVCVPNNDERQNQRQKVINRYVNLPRLRGTTGEGYLRNRGINVLPADAIKFDDNQLHAGRVYQTLYSLATDCYGELCYLHRTLLDGDKKAQLGNISTKRMKALQQENYLEYTRSVAIRMFPVSSTLGIAEGIETALSAYQIYGVNTWATINSGFMSKFIVPAGVRHLIIFADKDKSSATGQYAAFPCAHANLLAKNDLIDVTIRYPDEGDFNDVLMKGELVREENFIKKRQAA
ncbi:toprim domain-containing protein [Yersinia enterocolitica]|uniref:toprim domain-containing protein n=1 Tax=Yersinia enterocolitica TaxID=630 RepID=UPI001C8DA079|nr:toprim domain-containing protein [Yersinia enterocolitica]MBX9494560.1 toprim domain-containing protein [Yersinia enterocolitica]